MKRKIFLALYILFTILTIIGAIYVFVAKVNAGYAVIPMLFGIIFAGLHNNSKKEN